MKTLNSKQRFMLAVVLLIIGVVLLVFINLVWFVLGYAVHPGAFVASYYGNGTLADVEATSTFYYSIGYFTVMVSVVSVALGIALKVVKDKWDKGVKKVGC